VEHHRIHLLDKMRVGTAVDLTREVVSAGLASGFEQHTAS
jgi:hypothetical protein